MALETGTLPADLVVTNPTAGDPLSQADDHIRLLKVAVKNAASGPAFSAYQSTLQAVPNATFTKVQLQSEEFDTATAFDSATNYRFTPLVAGYYQISGATAFAAVGGAAATIFKNGAEYKRGVLQAPATPSYSQTVSALVYLNGSTDYVELYCYQASGSSQNTDAGATLTYFQGFLARLA